MSLGRDLGPDLLDLAFGIDKERRALDAHVLLPLHALLDPTTVLLNRLPVHIGEQLEFQTILVDKLLVLLRIVLADTKHHHTFLLELLDVATKTLRLQCTSGRIIFGVKIQN